MSVLDRFRLDGHVAVITGGARGIGRATAEAFVSAGAHVVLADVDLDEAQRAAAEIGNAEAHSLDVSSETDVNHLFGALVARTGRLDILVNNAGIFVEKEKTTELSKNEWDTVIAVNQSAVFLCSKAAAHHMLAGRRGGAIVNMASIMGFSGRFPNISYKASKGAVVNMTRALAIEWAKDNIRVNAVAPGWVRTNFIASVLADPEATGAIKSAIPMERLIEPEEVAAAILFLASPAASMITGHILAVDGGYLAS